MKAKIIRLNNSVFQREKRTYTLGTYSTVHSFLPGHARDTDSLSYPLHTIKCNGSLSPFLPFQPQRASRAPQHRIWNRISGVEIDSLPRRMLPPPLPHPVEGGRQ